MIPPPCRTSKPPTPSHRKDGFQGENPIIFSFSFFNFPSHYHCYRRQGKIIQENINLFLTFSRNLNHPASHSSISPQHSNPHSTTIQNSFIRTFKDFPFQLSQNKKITKRRMKKKINVCTKTNKKTQELLYLQKYRCKKKTFHLNFYFHFLYSFHHSPRVFSR